MNAYTTHRGVIATVRMEDDVRDDRDCCGKELAVAETAAYTPQ
jgi:hypothetical protein